MGYDQAFGEEVAQFDSTTLAFVVAAAFRAQMLPRVSIAFGLLGTAQVHDVPYWLALVASSAVISDG